MFDLPVFWPVLVMYWLILFSLTSKLFCHQRSDAYTDKASAEANTAYDQVPIRAVFFRQGQVQPEVVSIKSRFTEFTMGCLAFMSLAKQLYV